MVALEAAGIALAIMLVPGYVVARAWGVRPLVALACGPAVSVAWVSSSTLVLAREQVAWGWRGLVWHGPVAAWLALCVLGGAVGAWRRGRAAGGGGREGRPGSVRARRGWGRVRGAAAGWWRGADRGDLAAAGGAAVAGVMTAVPVWLGTGRGDSPAQASDAIFHLSATAVVRAQGNASFLGGLASLYDGRAVYYPTAWHAIAALLPGDVAVGANVMVVLVTAVLWPLGVAGLVRVVARAAQVRSAGVIGVAAALSGSVVSVVLVATSVWPYALSVALTPGAVALIGSVMMPASAGRAAGSCPGSGSWCPRWTTAVPALAAAGGVVLAHGTGAFNLLVLCAPVTVAWLLRGGRRLWRRGWWGRVMVCAGVAGAVAVIGAGAWVMRAPLASVLGFHRGSATVWETLYAVLTDHPLLATYTPWVPGNALLALAALAGACAWRRAPAVRPWVVAGVMSVALVFIAGGPQWWGRALAGPWYTQRARLMPLVSVCQLVLTLFALAEGQRWCRRRLPVWRARADRAVGGARGTGARRAVGAWSWRGVVAAGSRPVLSFLVLSLVLAPAWRWPLKEEILASIHDPARIAYGQMLSEGEEALVRQAAEVVPAGHVVVGDPSNGSAYLWPLAGVEVLYPVRPAPASGSERSWVAARLDQVATDAAVCQWLQDHDADYYYSDADSQGRASLWGEHWQVPQEVLEPVARGGSATLWRIRWEATPCASR